MRRVPKYRTAGAARHEREDADQRERRNSDGRHVGHRAPGGDEHHAGDRRGEQHVQRHLRERGETAGALRRGPPVPPPFA